MGSMFYVYEHWRPDRGECFYVGKGRGRRANKMIGRNLHHTAIQHKLSRMGLCVEVRLVATNLTEDEAFALEIERIAFWRADGADLANLTDGGEGTAGYIYTDEHRAKIAEAGRGRRHTEETRAVISAKKKGKPKTPEQVEAMRARLTGRKQSPEEIEARRAANTGKRRSDETRKRMSKAATGRIMSPEAVAKTRAALVGRKLDEAHRNAIQSAMRARAQDPDYLQHLRTARARKVVCITDGRRYDSAKFAAVEYGLDSSSVVKCCKRKVKTVGGKVFRYADLETSSE